MRGWREEAEGCGLAVLGWRGAGTCGWLCSATGTSSGGPRCARRADLRSTAPQAARPDTRTSPSTPPQARHTAPAPHRNKQLLMPNTLIDGRLASLPLGPAASPLAVGLRGVQPRQPQPRGERLAAGGPRGRGVATGGRRHGLAVGARGTRLGAQQALGRQRLRGRPAQHTRHGDMEASCAAAMGTCEGLARCRRVGGRRRRALYAAHGMPHRRAATVESSPPSSSRSLRAWTCVQGAQG
jgi:hypothetical protein